MITRSKTDAWLRPDHPPKAGFKNIHEAISNVVEPTFIVDCEGIPGACHTGTFISGGHKPPSSKHLRMLAYLPAIHPTDLGNLQFKNRYNIDYAYIAGDMAHGISSVELVKAAGKAGMLGFYGSAGLSFDELEHAILRLKSESDGASFGVNLIHSPGSPDREFRLVNLYLKHHIDLISAAGYLRLSAPLVLYRIKGIKKDVKGNVSCPHRIMGKASRIEVAEKFLSPPPEKIVRQLLEQKLISEDEAELSKYVPMVDDLTAEADSAGHTDNRPAISLLPSILNLRDELYHKFGYKNMPCIGLAGGIGTPMSLAAAITLGADYVVTGSINQACIESGTSDDVRCLLSTVCQTDVTMAPAADMFERGIRVQVLKRGTMFPQRASKLFEVYRQYDGFDQIPENIQREIEKKILQATFDQEWEQTRNFFAIYDPVQIQRAENDPKLKMALVFRSYLGKSSRWAITGDEQRIKDYQVWCGPSMGAFNEWTKNSFLEKVKNRSFETVAMNLLYGACVALRRQIIANVGICLPPDVGKFKPLLLQEIKNRLKMLK